MAAKSSESRVALGRWHECRGPDDCILVEHDRVGDSAHATGREGGRHAPPADTGTPWLEHAVPLNLRKRTDQRSVPAEVPPGPSGRLRWSYEATPPVHGQPAP